MPRLGSTCKGSAPPGAKAGALCSPQALAASPSLVHASLERASCCHRQGLCTATLSLHLPLRIKSLVP